MTIIIPFPKRKILKIKKTVGVSQKIKKQLSDLQKQRQEIQDKLWDQS